MNAKILSRHAGSLFAAAALVSVGISAASAAEPKAVAPATSGTTSKIVVDNTGATATPIELLLFVHRADLQLRNVTNK